MSLLLPTPQVCCDSPLVVTGFDAVLVSGGFTLYRYSDAHTIPAPAKKGNVSDVPKNCMAAMLVNTIDSAMHLCRR